MDPVSSPKQIEPKQTESSTTVLQTKADNQAPKKLDASCIREYWTQLNLFEIDLATSQKTESQIDAPKSVDSATYNNTKTLLNEFDIQPTSSTKQIAPKSVDSKTYNRTKALLNESDIQTTSSSKQTSPKSVGESENTEKNLEESIDKREKSRDYWIGLNQHFGPDKQMMVNYDTIDGYNELTDGIQSLYSTPSASCIDVSINENESRRSTSYMDFLKQLFFSLSVLVVPWSIKNSSLDNSVKKTDLMTPFSVSQTNTPQKLLKRGNSSKAQAVTYLH